MAIYNDFGFLSSIGEVTPGKDHKEHLPTVRKPGKVFAAENRARVDSRSDWLDGTEFPQVKVKPGSRAYIHKNRTEEEFDTSGMSTEEKRKPWLNGDDPITYEVVTLKPEKSGVTGNEGWARYDDRQ